MPKKKKKDFTLHIISIASLICVLLIICGAYIYRFGMDTFIDASIAGIFGAVVLAVIAAIILTLWQRRNQ